MLPADHGRLRDAGAQARASKEAMAVHGRVRPPTKDLVEPTEYGLEPKCRIIIIIIIIIMRSLSSS